RIRSRRTGSCGWTAVSGRDVVAILDADNRASEDWIGGAIRTRGIGSNNRQRGKTHYQNAAVEGEWVNWGLCRRIAQDRRDRVIPNRTRRGCRGGETGGDVIAVHQSCDGPAESRVRITIQPRCIVGGHYQRGCVYRQSAIVAGDRVVGKCAGAV